MQGCLLILRMAHPRIRERFRQPALPTESSRCRFRFRDTATKLTHDGPQTGLHPRCAQGQGRGQRSRDMGTFVTSQKSLLLASKWLDRHRRFTARAQEGPARKMTSRSRSRSKVMSYGHFCHVTKIAYSRAQIARSQPNLHTMFPGQACIQDVLKVKVEVNGHVIRAVSACHKNCFFSRANGSIATEQSQQGPRKGLHSE